MNREQLETKDFLYTLPDERIAKYPLDDRNKSKLLIRKNGELQEDVFSNLSKHLPDGAMLVFNDTKVLAARLIFTKSTGAKIEVFCLEPYNTTVEQALNTSKSCVWKCMVGNLKRFTTDTVLTLTIAGTQLKASIYKKEENEIVVAFKWEGDVSFSTILEAAGEVPIPPYLNRAPENRDKTNYQTVYAKNEGAVAAPTAGLHFVDTQLQQLKAKGHTLEYLTLFVGAGTFKTVKADKLVDHEMHKERIVIQKETIERLANHKKAIICVGTTSLRSLESLYWLAVKLNTTTKQDYHVGQNDAYTLPSNWTFNEACVFMLEFMREHKLQSIDFSSSLFIMPSYTWKSIDGLITNFHQPGSTLLALIASWVGHDWKLVYEHALQHNFRFLSYGDSSLLLK